MANVFCIITDETQDIAKHEHVAIVLRHVNDNLEVHESFLGFYRAKRTDSETLANELKNVLITLNIKHLRVQCYDGASNMRGPYKEVAANYARSPKGNAYSLQCTYIELMHCKLLHKRDFNKKQVLCTSKTLKLHSEIN